MPPAAHVSKFGGTSVATPERIRHAVTLGTGAPDGGRSVVVVSALGGTTDELVAALDAALAREGHAAFVAAVRQRHHAAADALAAPADRADLGRALDARLAELTELLDGVSLLREAHRPHARRRARDRRAARGSARRRRVPGRRPDGRRARRRRPHPHGRPLRGRGRRLRDDARGSCGPPSSALPGDTVAVVTGFIGSTEAGVTTTLGRSGSDYTATIVAEALGAAACTIWTDVAGVYTADPRLVPEATPLARLSYREAAELAYFGAQVLHPRTMLPAERAGIPLLIKSTLDPDAPGTVISAATDALDLRVKALSAVRDQAVVTVEGGGLQSVVGVSARLFAALSEAGVNVRMISQASSEQSICVVVDAADAARVGGGAGGGLRRRDRARRRARRRRHRRLRRRLGRRRGDAAPAGPGRAALRDAGPGGRQRARHRPGRAPRRTSRSSCASPRCAPRSARSTRRSRCAARASTWS